MPAAESKALVEQYFERFARKDFEGNRDCLSETVSFKGPIDTFHSREDFLQAVSRLAPVMQEARKKKVFADGDDVCILWDFVMNPTGEVVPISESFRVEGGKITEIRLLFDPRSFLALMAG